jgi:RNA polymerase sigma-70 factor (ECF subfamily)
VTERRPRYPATREDQRRVLEAFLAAVGEGDVDGLMAVLDPDVVMRSDGGGRVRAARKPVQGAERVGRVVLGVARKNLEGAELEIVDVNGAPGVLVREASGDVSVGAFTVDGGRITAIDVVRNPDKLKHVHGSH